MRDILIARNLEAANASAKAFGWASSPSSPGLLGGWSYRVDGGLGGSTCAHEVSVEYKQFPCDLLFLKTPLVHIGYFNMADDDDVLKLCNFLGVINSLHFRIGLRDTRP